MPDTPLGQELAAAVPDPPVTIDATDVLTRARRRTHRRLAVWSATATLAVLSIVVLVDVALPGAPDVSLVTTKATSPSPSPAVTPTALAAPDVRGLPVDAAMTAVERAGCGASVGAVVNAPAPVGAVVAQSPTSDSCDVALTISAGPRSSAPPCTSLVVTAGTGGAGLGHFGFPLLFRNTGRSPCSLSGYATVTATDSQSGRTVTARQTANGYLGGTTLPVPTLVLAPGDQVSALVEGTDTPVGTATSCPGLSQMRVTVNGHTTPVAQGLTNCSGMEVHPYVPGTTGSA